MARGDSKPQKSARDYKKIKVLNYLANNSDGANKYTLTNLPSSTGQNYIDMNQLLADLLEGNLIEQFNVSAKSVAFKITDDGRALLEEIRELKLRFQGNFDIFQALDEPTSFH